MSFLGIPQFTLNLIAFIILLFCLGLNSSDREIESEPPNKPKLEKIDNEAISALMGLGFRKTQAREAVVKALFEDPLLSTEELIKAALQKT